MHIVPPKPTAQERTRIPAAATRTWFRRFTGVCVLTLLASGPMRTAAAAERARQHRLPQNPGTVVIAFDYEGGFTPPRQNQEPRLAIRADGTAVVGAPFGRRKRIQGRISPQRLSKIVSFLLDELHLATFDEEKIKQAVARENRKRGRFVPRIADAPTTVVRIRADGREYVAKYYAVTMAAGMYPAIPELRRLEEARRFLERLCAELSLGGPQGVARMLALVNAELQKKFPNTPPLTERDLQGAGVNANGRVSVTFQREENLGAKRKRVTTANVIVPATGAEPEVKVFVRLLENNRVIQPKPGRA
ncbi:MAG: hypothetical protein D6725_15515 [Planctomycetota bacterium]|nr:MAG: hypothetical protein D6725_15515 [Planctomycetota bacterium]